MNGAFKRSTGPRAPVSRRLVPLAAILLVLVLVLYAVLRPPAESPEPSGFTAVAVRTYVEETTPTEAPPRTGVLSETNDAERAKVEAFFGPLPHAEAPKKASHVAVRGIYILEGANLDTALQLAEAKHINAVVIDLKEHNGLRYQSKIALAREIGAVSNHPLAERIARLKQAGLHVIGRIVCFKDTLLVNAKPDRAIQDANGQVLAFSGEGGVGFLNPYDRRNWDYNIAIANEAIDLGVDEIQFDYVRFPTGRTTSGLQPYFGEAATLPTRAQAVNRFLETARIEITEKRGVPIGADVFSIVIGSRLDGDILGQDWRSIGQTGIDNVCPMVYPSHYANASVGHYTGNGEGTYFGGKLFDKPDLHPFDVTKLALMEGQAVSAYPNHATIRPYLQAFTATYLPAGYYMEYDAAAVAQTIAAVYAAGYEEWILWSPSATYDPAVFTDAALQSRPDTAQEPAAP